jgi:hypothetical protein
VTQVNESSSVKPVPDKVGLCERCVHARRIASSRGSLFYLCELSEVDGTFPRYPRLPVVRCPGFIETDTSVAE